MKEKILQLLAELRLKGMADVLGQELIEAERKGRPPAEVLHRLLRQEYSHRQERSMLYRLKNAKIPWDWTLKTFPFK